MLEDAADEIDRMVFTNDATKNKKIEELLQHGGNFLTVTDMKKKTKLNFIQCARLYHTIPIKRKKVEIKS